MAPPAAYLIRAGSGLLFALLGLATLVISKGHRRAVLVGLTMGAFGGLIILRNLAQPTTLTPALVDTALSLVSGGSAFALALDVPRPARREERLMIAAGATLAVVYELLILLPLNVPTLLRTVAVLPAIGEWAVPLAIADTVAFAGLFGLVMIVSLRVARAEEPSNELRSAAAIVGALGLYFAFEATAGVDPRSFGALGALLLLVFIVSGGWLAASARSGAPVASRFALAFAAFAFLGLAYAFLPANATSYLSDVYGLNGVVRVVGWAFLAYAILRWDALGVPLPRIAISRGAVAAGALATLFIVAQIAQNFFSAEFGLLTGGIVAGAFVFAAQPLQRAMESMRERPSPALSEAPREIRGLHTSQSEHAYRVMLRRALADGSITAEEELALAHLADEAGLTTRRVTEIRHEVERELGRRA